MMQRDRNLGKQWLVGLGYIFSFCLIIPAFSWAANAPQGIIVSYLEDKALFRPQADAPWETLKIGQSLFPNYEIKTLVDTRLTIRLRDGSEVRVAPNSYLRINSQTNSERGEFDFQLILGKAWAKFRKNLKLGAKLILRTANAKINIQGTSYEATVSENQTDVRVFSGQVAVSSNLDDANQGATPPTEIEAPHEVSREEWHVIVSAFYTISVAEDQPPGEPQPFSLDSVQSDWVQWNLDRDQEMQP